MSVARPYGGHDVGGFIEARRRDERIDDVLRREVVESGAADVAVAGWARRSAGSWHLAVGAVGAAENAIFDLASVTKPLTALVAARCCGETVRAVQVMPLMQSRLGEVLPGLARSAAGDVRLEDLLAHRAGLPAWGAIYRADPWRVEGVATIGEASLAPDRTVDRHELAELLARAASRRRLPRDLAPESGGAPEVYSDLGYILAGAMITRVLGAPLADGWRAVAGATSARAWRALDATFDERVVATEHVAWRGGEVRGVVHDENAYFLERAGGDPGHAGAFGTVDQLVELGARYVDAVEPRGRKLRAPLLPRAVAIEMIAPRGGGSHRLGWDGITIGSSSTGRHFGPRTFGHLGFTGTSLWCDPDAGAVAVLLTNRTWPSRAKGGNGAIRAARPRVHDALWGIDP